MLGVPLFLSPLSSLTNVVNNDNGRKSNQNAIKCIFYYLSTTNDHLPHQQVIKMMIKMVVHVASSIILTHKISTVTKVIIKMLAHVASSIILTHKFCSIGYYNFSNQPVMHITC